MLINCDYCGKEFYKKPSHIAKSKTNCCSKDCADSIKGSKVIICDYCGKKMRRGKKYIGKSKNHFCGRECLSKYKKEQNEVKCSNCNKSIYRCNYTRDENKTDIYFCNMKCKSSYYQKINQVVCVVCNKKFYKNSAEQKRSPVHCCSLKCVYEFNNKRVKINCKNCDKILYRPPSLLEGKQNIFCSKECYDEFQDNKVEFKCEKCNKKAKMSKSLYDRGRHHFCSVECCAKYKFKESFVESQFEELVKKLDIKYDRNTRSIVGPLELDFYFPDINYAVEVNGIIHYKPIYGEKHFKGQKERDRRKRKKCKELGITLRTVKPGNCKYETFMPRYKRVVWEIKKHAGII